MAVESHTKGKCRCAVKLALCIATRSYLQQRSELGLALAKTLTPRPRIQPGAFVFLTDSVYDYYRLDRPCIVRSCGCSCGAEGGERVDEGLDFFDVLC